MLCREASLLLDLNNSSAMGGEEGFTISGIECIMSFDQVRSSAQMTFDLGDPRPGSESEIYARLLELQMTFVGQMDALFLRDTINDRLLFTVRIPLSAQLSPKALVNAIQVLVTLVDHFQKTALAGAMMDYDQAMEAYLMGADTDESSSRAAAESGSLLI